MAIAGKAAVAAAVISLGVGAAWGADMPVKAPYVAVGPSTELWLGFDVNKDSDYGYIGGVYAYNGNLNKDGWLFRLNGGDGHYEYNRAVGVRQGVDFQTGDVMIGYQTFVGHTRYSGYVGAYIQNDDNSDPAAKVKGTRVGAKVQGEIFSQFDSNWYGLILANYASAWNNYLVMAKLGYQITPTVSIGPEGMAIGNDRYDEARAGAFVALNVTPSAQLILSGGYSWDERSNNLNDHSGGYGTVHLRWTF
ncbi:MAG TPA: cellulose biosynthesis protein BcsS [Xanthobacteraceae bacterium]|nr:cellulose biosynthesis protein BcsS [Xanthobacteraceae bacterium]